DPISATIIGFIMSNWGFNNGVSVADPNGIYQYGHPIYYGQASDPVYTLHCSNNNVWGTCALEGQQVHIPNGAQPAGGTDGHIAVIDQTTGNEYDMWQGQGTAMGGGSYSCTYGGMGPFDGSGLGFAATAAGLAAGAGDPRPEELVAGQINHALFGVFACCNGTAVGPIAANGGHCDTQCSNGQGAAVGQRYMLNMTDAEILALGKDPASTAILMAMAHYGIIQGDENGNYAGSISVVPGFAYTVLGGTDPMAAYASTYGLAADGRGGFTLDYGSGVDWANKLVLLDPCGSAGMCSAN
ncbi:MAG: hypothetical protein ACYCWW_17885, partial [Deltaproteobacteria bacterium]